MKWHTLHKDGKTARTFDAKEASLFELGLELFLDSKRSKNFEIKPWHKVVFVIFAIPIFIIWMVYHIAKGYNEEMKDDKE